MNFKISNSWSAIAQQFSVFSSDLMSTCTVSFMLQHWIEICLLISDTMIRSVLASFSFRSDYITTATFLQTRRRNAHSAFLLDEWQRVHTHVQLRSSFSPKSFVSVNNTWSGTTTRCGQIEHVGKLISKYFQVSSFRHLNFRLPPDCVSTESDSKFRSAASSLLRTSCNYVCRISYFSYTFSWMIYAYLKSKTTVSLHFRSNQTIIFIINRLLRVNHFIFWYRYVFRTSNWLNSLTDSQYLNISSSFFLFLTNSMF